VALSFDCFGTLGTADRPTEPWTAVADELRKRDVSVPEDWERVYRSTHVSVERGAECSLVEHTVAALDSRCIDTAHETVHDALLSAFDGPVEVRAGAADALDAASAVGPVGILSNCSVPGLVDRTLERADLPAVDVVVTSVGCGWRKPHDRAFRAIADRLDAPVDTLVHVGDDPRTDGGGRTAGVTVVLTEDVPLAEFPGWLEERKCR
jgi:FMN phosphatase YigB (HAD superfamily)